MNFITVLTFLAVLVAPSFQLWGGGSTSNSNKSPNYERGINCFSRCRDAYLANKNNYYARGCSCSRYDLSAFGDHKPSSSKCNCPSGTTCRQENGKTRCEPEPAPNPVPQPVPQPLPKSLPSSVSKPRPLPIPKAPAAPGLQRRGRPLWNASPYGLTNSCGYLAPSCCARSGTYDYVYRYTYDHHIGMCIRSKITLSCAHMYGVHDNIFHNYRQCSRECSADMKY